MQTIGDRLLQVRGELGLTQAEVASMVNVNKTTYLAWEKGARLPELSAVMTIAEKSGKTLDWLCLGKEAPGIPPNTTELDLMLFHGILLLGQEKKEKLKDYVMRHLIYGGRRNDAEQTEID